MRSARFAPSSPSGPPPVRVNELVPVAGFAGWEGPPLPPPGVVTRPATYRRAYTLAVTPAAEHVTGAHGDIVAQPGLPVGVQLAWDGPRRMTFRLPPGSWAEGMVVEDYTREARS